MGHHNIENPYAARFFPLQRKIAKRKINCAEGIIVVQLAHGGGGKMMPQIIPIRDLKKTSELSELCRSAKEPVFITKNGYGDMVIMSMETYERTMFLNDVYRKLDEGERSIQAGNVMDAFDSIKDIREKYGL